MSDRIINIDFVELDIRKNTELLERLIKRGRRRKRRLKKIKKRINNLFVKF